MAKTIHHPFFCAFTPNSIYKESIMQKYLQNRIDQYQAKQAKQNRKSKTFAASVGSNDKAKNECEYLKVRDLCRELNISMSVGYELIRLRKIDSFNFHGAIRVKRSDLERYIEKSKVAAIK